MLKPRSLCLSFGLLALAGCVHPSPAPATESPGLASKTGSTTAAAPAWSSLKLDVLNDQVKQNPNDAQAVANRGYVLSLLGRKIEARADLEKATSLKDTPAMHNRVGWAYFNLGDYATAVREFELGAQRGNFKAHYDYYSLVLGYWGTDPPGFMNSALPRISHPVRSDKRRRRSSGVSPTCPSTPENFEAFMRADESTGDEADARVQLAATRLVTKTLPSMSRTLAAKLKRMDSVSNWSVKSCQNDWRCRACRLLSRSLLTQ